MTTWSLVFKDAKGSKVTYDGKAPVGGYHNTGDLMRVGVGTNTDNTSSIVLRNATSGARFAQVTFTTTGKINVDVDELNLPHVAVAKKAAPKADEAVAGAAPKKRKADEEPAGEQPEKKKAKTGEEKAAKEAKEAKETAAAKPKVKQGERKPDETDEEYQKRLERNRKQREARLKKAAEGGTQDAAQAPSADGDS